MQLNEKIKKKDANGKTVSEFIDNSNALKFLNKFIKFLCLNLEA